MSLAMYLYPQERITEPHHSNGYCAMTERISDRQYTAAELPSDHVSVLTYVIKAPHPNDSCKPFNDRTIAVVDIIEAKAREKKMVTVQSGEMAKAIADTGRIALYGIYLTSTKPTSNPNPILRLSR